MYIATIINCPWARLMIPMTPMMSVMPIPIRAYNPPLRTPATRVWRKTSMEPPGAVDVWSVEKPGGDQAAARPREGFTHRLRRNYFFIRSFHLGTGNTYFF